MEWCQTDQSSASCPCPSAAPPDDFPIHRACWEGDLNKLRNVLYLHEPQKLVSNLELIAKLLVTRATFLVPKKLASSGNRSRSAKLGTPAPPAGGADSSASMLNVPAHASADGSHSNVLPADTAMDVDEAAGETMGTSVDGEFPLAKSAADDTDAYVRVEGYPAELAVQGSHFLCARIALSMMLLIRIKHAGWSKETFSRFRDTMQWGFSILHMKLCSNEGSSFIATLHFLDFRLEPSEVDALKVLLTACLLGSFEVVKTVIQMQSKEYWDERFPAPYHNWITYAEATLVAAASGGDYSCLHFVLTSFRDMIRFHLVTSTEDAVLNVLWGWKVTETKECLEMLKRSFPNSSLHSVRIPLTTFVDAIADAASWLSYGVPNETLLCSQKPLPAPTDVEESVQGIMSTYEAHWNRSWEYSAANAILAAWQAGKVRDKLVDESTLENLMEDYICQFLTYCNRAEPGCILLQKDLLHFLTIRKSDYRKGLLLTVSQCWYVTCDKSWKACPMCNPLVSFALFAGGESTYHCLLSEGFLATLASCFSLKDLAHTLKLLEVPQTEAVWCQAHFNHPGRRWLGTLHSSAPEILKMLESCIKDQNLQNMAVRTVLDSLGGDCRQIRKMAIPGSLMRYFAINQFLKKW